MTRTSRRVTPKPPYIIWKLFGPPGDDEPTEQVSLYTYKVMDREKLRKALGEVYPYPFEVYRYGMSAKVLRIEFTVSLPWKRVKALIAEAWEALNG